MFTHLHKDFPILQQTPYGKRLAYLDSAATTQKPNCVIDAYQEFYSAHNANVHRGVHFLAASATQLFENTREKIRNFINARYIEECIFTRGTTEAINLVASVLSEHTPIKAICVTQMEHHSNLVPWQMLAKSTGAHLKYIPLTVDGTLDLNNLEELLVDTSILAITHVSNTLGTINPIKEIIQLAKKHNIIVLVDGTQAPAHMAIDVQDLDCDFYTISAHKMYGPMGVGLLYGKRALLEELPPYHGGGEMIREVYLDHFTCAGLPHKFEAGTPAVADLFAWSKALDYLQQNVDYKLLQQHEQNLLHYAYQKLANIEELTCIGATNTDIKKIGVISFVIKNLHPHDLGTIVDHHGIALRTGHHCTMPLMQYFNLPATNRISFGLYNTTIDIDQLIDAILYAKKIFKL